MLRPWFRLAAELLMPLIKLLQPTQVEITFCYAIMLYGCEDDLSIFYNPGTTFTLSPATLSFMRSMTIKLYNGQLLLIFVSLLTTNFVYFRVERVLRRRINTRKRR